MKLVPIVFRSLLCSAMFLAGAQTQAITIYTLTDLGTLGGNVSYGLGINNAGQVTGFSYTVGDAAQHAFLYSGGVMNDLGTLGGTNSDAYDINNAGQVTGYADVAGDSAYHAYLYSNGTMTDLGALGGQSARGASINDAGQVTGWTAPSSDIGSPYPRGAFLYSGGSSTDLGSLYGGDTFATGINNSGQVVGQSNDGPDPFGTTHAFIYSNGAMTDLGSLGGPLRSGANGINDLGQVTGFSTTADGSVHPFLYANGVMTDLGTLGASTGEGRAINKLGQVTGYSGSQAFVYSDGVMTDLNTLLDPSSEAGWDLTIGEAINDVGQIVVNGYKNGVQHALLLTPVPEFSTYAFMAVGLGLLGFLRAKRATPAL